MGEEGEEEEEEEVLLSSGSHEPSSTDPPSDEGVAETIEIDMENDNGDEDMVRIYHQLYDDSRPHFSQRDNSFFNP